jgi:hypothetical protein
LPKIARLNNSLPVKIKGVTMPSRDICQTAVRLRGLSPEKLSPNLIEFFITYIKPEIHHPIISAELNISPERTKNFLAEGHFLATWAEYGMPVYRLTESAIGSFLLTDPVNVDFKEVKPPFPSMWIEFPPNYWILERPSDGKKVYLQAMTFHEHKNPIADVDLYDATLDDAFPDETYWVLSALFSDARESDSMMDVMSKFVTTTLAPDTQDLYKKWVTSKIVPPKSIYESKRDQLKEEGVFSGMIRIFVNMCMYIAECKSHAVRRSHYLRKGGSKKHKKRDEGLTDTWVVGKELKIEKEVIEGGKHWLEMRRGDRTKWRLTKRIVVCGHWKKQPYGPKHSLRKTVWIKPYVKNPKSKKKLIRRYKVNVKESY